MKTIIQTINQFSLPVVALLTAFAISGIDATAHARTEPQPEQTEPQPEQPANLDPAPPSQVRPWLASYSLSPIGLFVPIKHGPAARYVANPNWAFEVSYFTGQLGISYPFIDVGSFKESLVLLQSRYHPRQGSFNWILGLSHQSYKAHLGSALVSRLTNTQSHFDVLNVQSLGLHAGLGNQFRIGENFVLAVDWAVVNVPLTTLKSEAPALEAVASESDRQHVQDVLRIMRNLPTITLLKTSIGYSF